MGRIDVEAIMLPPVNKLRALGDLFDVEVENRPNLFLGMSELLNSIANEIMELSIEANKKVEALGSDTK
ncbi:hypothetical protein KA005_27235 [bacterium]|nr:hypothetical protein [bacterium]